MQYQINCNLKRELYPFSDYLLYPIIRFYVSQLTCSPNRRVAPPLYGDGQGRT